MGKSLAQKAAEKGININTVRARMRYGWSEQKALNTPVNKKLIKKEDQPKVQMPKDIEKPADMEKYEDGFVLTISILFLAVAIFGILWLLTK